MNSFGLGLVLSFTDNASAGMRRASQTFNEMNRISDQMVSASSSAVSSIETLSLAGYGLNVVGDQMVNAGSTIVGVFGSASQSIINTGLELDMFERQLSALYGDKTAKLKIAEIQKYAQDSVFSVKDLTSAVVMMKAVGIEAMADVTTSTGSTTQKLLDYASDLAAMYPTMRNVYGTGVNAAMGAIKEYIAEGNARSLKAGAGLDITAMLGEDKGASIEERTQQIADLIDKMNIAGYTQKLMGTPTQQLEKMQDALYNAMGRIANEGGVLSKYTTMLSMVATYVEKLSTDKERMNTLITIVGDSLSSLLDPLQKVVERLLDMVDSFIRFAEAHPMLSKFIVKVVALTGVTLLALGTVMKLSGSFLILFASIKSVSETLQAAKGLKTFTRLLGTLKASFLPIIAVAGLAYVAWKNNFFGIRDVVQKTFQDIGTIFSLVSDAFTDNALSPEQFEKANQLGLLPLIESILMLKYYAGIFFEGFKNGIEGILAFVGELTRSWGILDTDIMGSAQSIGEVLRNLFKPGMEDTWRAIGEAVAQATVALLAFVSAYKAISGIISICSKIATLFAKIGSAIAFIKKILVPVIGLFKWFGAVISLLKEGFGFFEVMGAAFPKIAAVISKILPVLTKVGTAIMGVVKAIAAALGISTGWVVAIIAAVVAVVALVIIFRKQIAQFFKNLWVSIVDIFNKAKEKISQVVQSIVTFFMPVIEFFQAVGRLIKTVIMGVVGVIKSGFNLIRTIIRNVMRVVSSIFRVFRNLVRYVVLSILVFFKNAFTKIKEAVIDPVISWISEKFQWLKDNVFTPIKNFFIAIWQEAVEFVTPIIEGFVTAFNIVKDNIILALTAVKDWFIQVIDGITAKVNTFFEGIKSIFNWISDKIDGIGDFLSSGLNKVADWLGVNGDAKEGELVGAATGGYVKTTGIGVLHPNELVVNDKMTQQLGAFLDNQMAMSVAPASVVNVNSASSQGANKEGYIDSSVTFAAGSIVIQMNNASDAELEKVADKLMKIIARKQQLQGMAVRK